MACIRSVALTTWIRNSNSFSSVTYLFIIKAQILITSVKVDYMFYQLFKYYNVFEPPSSGALSALKIAIC